MHHMRHTLAVSLIAAAFAAVVHVTPAADLSGATPAALADCVAIKYLTTPGQAVSVSGRWVTEMATHRVEFATDGTNWRALRSFSTKPPYSGSGKYLGSYFKWLAPEGGNATLTEMQRPSGDSSGLPEDFDARGTSCYLGTLGLPGCVNGSATLNGGVLTWSTRWLPEHVDSIRAVPTLDSKGRIATMLVEARTKAEFLSAFSTSTQVLYCYDYAPNPNVAAGFPTSWTRSEITDGKALLRERTIIDAWSTTPEPATAFDPNSWAKRVTLHVYDLDGQVSWLDDAGQLRSFDELH